MKTLFAYFFETFLFWWSSGRFEIALERLYDLKCDALELGDEKLNSFNAMLWGAVDNDGDAEQDATKQLAALELPIWLGSEENLK